ncbi:MAG: DUF2341 domain-containing protein, partial [Nitrosomonadaceae bacterium]
TIQFLSTATDTIFHMYYGNSEAADQQDVVNTWDSNYKAVWHFKETPDAVGETWEDSTSNSNDVNVVSCSGCDVISIVGKIGNALNRDSSGDNFVVPNSSSLNIVGKEVTIEGWVRVDTPHNQDAAFVQLTPSTNAERYMLGIDGGTFPGKINHRVTTTDGHFRYDTGSIDDEQWTYVAMVYDGTLLSNPRFFAYDNGVKISSNSASGDILSSTADILIGKRSDGRGFVGNLDEFRVSDVARSDAYITTSYNSQSSPSTFLSIGSQTISPAGLFVTDSPTITDSGGSPAPWFDTSFLFRQTITIDSTKVISNSDHIDFPVLVSKSSDTNLNSANVQSNGNDIFFTDALGIKIPHEIESFSNDASTGTLVAWVKVPILSSSIDTILFMYYGNPTAANQQDVVNVWDSNYKAVWHLSEDPDAAGEKWEDSTSNNNDIVVTTCSQCEQISIADGQIGRALELNSGGDRFVAFDSPSLDITGDQFTLEGWARLDTPNPQDAAFIHKSPGTNQERYMLGVDGGTDPALINHRVTTDSGHFRYDTGSIEDDEWTYTAAIYNGSLASNPRFFAYDNGVKISSNNAEGDILTTTADVLIGKRADGRLYVGQLDELRISDVARSDAYITTSYNNQNSPSTFLSCGPQEISPDGIFATDTPTITDTDFVPSGSTTIWLMIQETSDNKSTDDAEQNTWSGNMNLFSNTLDINKNDVIVGLR